MISSGNEAVVGYAGLSLRARPGRRARRSSPAISRAPPTTRKLVRALEEARRPAEAGRPDQGGGDERERPGGAGPHRRARRRGSRGRRRPAGAGRDPRVLDRGARRRLAPAGRQPGRGCRPAGASASSRSAAATGSWRWTSARSSGSRRPRSAPRASSGCGRCSSRWRRRPTPSISPRPRRSAPESLALLPQALDAVAAEPEIHTVLVIAGSMAARAREIATVMEGFARRAREAGLRQLALAAPRHPGAAGRRRGLLLPRSRPGRAGHRPARRAGRGGRSPASAPAGDGRGPHGLRLGGARARTAPATSSFRGPLPPRSSRRRVCPSPPRGWSGTTAAAVRRGRGLGFPVVLKGISPSVTHRAAAGLLAVDLRIGGGGDAAAHRRLEAGPARSASRSTACTSRRCTGVARSSCSRRSGIRCSA